MKDGIIRVAAATPVVAVADVEGNKQRILEMIDEAESEHVSVLVFPELALTGYTCGDLFLQKTLLASAREALSEIVDYSKKLELLIVVGLPFEHNCKLYNVQAYVCHGELIGLVPKTFLPNYNEFYELRHFASGAGLHTTAEFTDSLGISHDVPFDTDLLFTCRTVPQLVVAGELCEDVWAPNPPSIRHALAGATVIVNSSASDEGIGKTEYRRDLISGQSARLVCGYVYANTGDGESTQDVVFGGHDIIAENGTLLAESKKFKSGMIVADLDLGRIESERRRMTSFSVDDSSHRRVYFTLKCEKLDRIRRYIAPQPFVPASDSERDKRCEEILSIQANGLKKRLAHTGSRHAVIGISGGLDSTLALLVTVKAFDLLGIPRENIISVTMPCFGTTDRTYSNACLLTKKLSATLKEVDIKAAVKQHFADIGQDESVHDVTYENCQARERTQVLMDIANKNNGLVIGTGDLSELALGWATYNGDHMSMYGVNSSVPKTLVRHLVRYYADTCGDEELSATLLDILDTPVSPELLPPENGVISQKTEDLVGPYELHDFFLYYMLRFGYGPKKLFRYASQAFESTYEPEYILKWLGVFVRRFFAQQFKRSCLPDGPKVGSVAVSPRGDLRMPSDAVARMWLKEVEEIEI